MLLAHQHLSSDCVLALSVGGGLSHNASSCVGTAATTRQPRREDVSTSLHSAAPSALIHHHPPPQSPAPPPSSSSSSTYPSSPGYPLGMGNTGQPYQQQQQQQQQSGNRGSASVYSAKVLAFQQGSNRPPPPASFGLQSGSQSSRPSSTEDSADSFFHFDSISPHQPYQHPHHPSFPQPGPLHPSELQLAGKHHLTSHPIVIQTPRLIPKCHQRPVAFFPYSSVVSFLSSLRLPFVLCNCVFCPASCPWLSFVLEKR